MCGCCVNPSEEGYVCQAPVDLYFEGIQTFIYPTIFRHAQSGAF